jgi:hypothetical protein
MRPKSFLGLSTRETKQDFSKAGDKLKRHIYDYVLTDSNVEREFVKELDTCSEVVVYVKLPRGFHPDTRRGLQPRLGHLIQGGVGQARVLRGRNQVLDVDYGAQRDREDQDQVRPQIL